MPDQIQREIELPVSSERAWDAVTSADGLAGWLAEEVHLDAVPGGDAWFMEDGRERTGWVEEVLAPDGARPGRLAFWWSEDGGTASRVELTVIGAGKGRARVRVLETRPLELLDLVATPLPGTGDARRFGPALLAGCC